MNLTPHPTIPRLFISDDGRAFYEMGTEAGDGGYPHLTIPGERNMRRLHVLVCETFHGPRPHPKAQTRHLDGNPAHNAPNNLAWGTSRDNMNDKKRHGRILEGETHPSSRLTEDVVMAIRQAYAAGETVLTLAGRHKISKGHIRQIVTGTNWKHLPIIPVNRVPKLTADDVRAIRKDLAEGRLGRAEIGKSYGVSGSAIYAIAIRRNWKHLPDDTQPVHHPKGNT